MLATSRKRLTLEGCVKKLFAIAVGDEYAFPVKQSESDFASKAAIWCGEVAVGVILN